MNHRSMRASYGPELSLQRLLAMSPASCATLPKSMPRAGVYLLSEMGQHLYIGRSNGIKGRLGRHSLPGASHKEVALAF